MCRAHPFKTTLMASSALKNCLKCTASHHFQSEQHPVASSLDSFLGIFPLSSLSVGLWIAPVAAVPPPLVHACLQDYTSSVGVCNQSRQLKPTGPSCQWHCPFTEHCHACNSRTSQNVASQVVLYIQHQIMLHESGVT